MTKDERERLARVEQMVPLVEEIRADVKSLLQAHHEQVGFIRAGAMFLTALGAMIGAVLAAYWPRIKGWL